MRIHAILDRALFKQGEVCDVGMVLYDSDGRPLKLEDTDLITINAKRWIDSTEYLLKDTSCDITNADFGECGFSVILPEDVPNGRYLAEITLQRIVESIDNIYKSSDITIWIDRGL